MRLLGRIHQPYPTRRLVYSIKIEQRSTGNDLLTSSGPGVKLRFIEGRNDVESFELYKFFRSYGWGLGRNMNFAESMRYQGQGMLSTGLPSLASSRDSIGENDDF